MAIKLIDRINNYASISQYKLLPKLPVIIVVNGRSFTKATALLDKPYSSQLMETMCSTLTYLLQEIDGAVFGYVFNDEIVIIARNDQQLTSEPWLHNDIQKLVSTTAAMATLHFNTYATSIELNIPDAILTAQAFVVPNITEAINTIIAKQQQNFQTSIHFACFYELLKKNLNKEQIKEMIGNSNIDEKTNLLEQECGVIYNDYPVAFRHGVACYKTPQIVKFGDQEIVKNKWKLDVNLPVFTKTTLLQDILKETNEKIHN